MSTDRNDNIIDQIKVFSCSWLVAPVGKSILELTHSPAGSHFDISIACRFKIPQPQQGMHSIIRSLQVIEQ